jgi:hypothetical protein
MHPPQEARRWAKFPATLLFALSVVWLVYTVSGLNPASLKDETETGLGSLRVLFEYAIIPLGSAVCGLGLLFLQRWAYLPAALLPLWPLLIATYDKVQRIDSKFGQFHQTQNMAYLGNGVLDCLAVAALWTAYLLILAYLRKSYQLLGGWNNWARASGSKGRAGRAPAPLLAGYMGQAEEGDTCWLMPETDDEEQS